MKKAIVACTLAALLYPLLAQEENSATKDRVIRLSKFGTTADETRYALATGLTPGDAFTLPNNGFTPPIPLPAGESPVSLVIPGEENEDGTPSFERVGVLDLPESGKRFIGILLPVGEGRLRGIIIDAEQPDFRPGHVMIFNFADETLGADLGGEKLAFKPGSRTIFTPTREQEDKANYQVAFYRSVEGNPKMFAPGLWRYFDNKRAYVFLYVDPETGRPTYRSIDEFTGWLEDEE